MDVLRGLDIALRQKCPSGQLWHCNKKSTVAEMAFSLAYIHCKQHQLWRHYTVLALLGSTRLGLVPGTTFSITIVPTQCGRGSHAAVCGFPSHTKQVN